MRLFCDICMDFSIIECDSNAYIILMRHLYDLVTKGLGHDTFDQILADPTSGPSDNLTIVASYLKAIYRIMEYDNGNLCASTFFEKAKIAGKKLEYEEDPEKKLVHFEQGHDYLDQAATKTRSHVLKADRYLDLGTFLKVYEMLKEGKELSQLLVDIIKYMRLAYKYNPGSNEICTFYYELSRIQSYVDGEEFNAYENALKALKILDKKYPPSQDANIEDMNIITKKLNFINQARLTSEPISVTKRREMELRKVIIQGGTVE
jgi:hypothetical protein